jgi:hypothetical protein
VIIDVKKEFILNEEEYVQNIIKTNIKPDLGFFKFLIMVIKYFSSTSQDLSQVKNNVNIIMKNIYYEEYVPEKWEKLIEEIFKNVIDNKIQLKKIEKIIIYDVDMVQVFKGKDNKERKLLFTAFVLAHFRNAKGWLNFKDKSDLINWFNLANVSGSLNDNIKIISSLNQNNLIFTTKKCDSLNIKVNLLEDYSEHKSIFEITEIKNLGNLLISTYDENYAQCPICGKLIKNSTVRIVKCKKCAELTKRH